MILIFFVTLRFCCIRADHECEYHFAISGALKKFRKSPTSISRGLVDNTEPCMQRNVVHWLVNNTRLTRVGSRSTSRARVCVTSANIFYYVIVNVLLLFFSFVESNRFHHLKEFPYNYEGETVSSIAGSSSARSGLKIRARCVVKAVAPCQHVLKVR